MKLDYAKNLFKKIKSDIIGKHSLIVAGSIRRKSPNVDDIDILVISDKSPFDKLRFRSLNTRKKLSGARHTSYIIEGIHIDFFWVRRTEKPFALFHYTGSSRYNIRVRAYAKKKGYLLNQYGLFKNGKKIPNLKTEKNIANYLGITYRVPSNRII